MKSNYRKLGEFIRTVDERNRDLAITNLQGVSITKDFVPSIANIIGTDLSTYKIVRTGQFAYGPVTSRNGDKVSIALLKGDDCIISSSYIPFEVYKPDELLPEYLMLWFMRPEFDRYARFMSNGSAREVFDWDCMCDVEIPVPSIDKQRRIVHDYQVITDRIELLRKINRNLEEQNLAFYRANIVTYELNDELLPASWEKTTVGSIASVTRGASPRPIDDYICTNGMPWVKISDASASFSKYLFDTAECIIDEGVNFSRLVTPKTMIVSNSASPGLPMLLETTACVHDGWLIIDHFQKVSQEYMYYYFIDNRKSLISSSNGSVFNNLKTDIVKEHPIVVPDNETMRDLTKHFQISNKLILANAKEARALMNLQINLLGKIMF